MKNDIKKVIATALAAGGMVAGGFIANDKLNQLDCAYIVEWKGQEICFTEEEKQVIESGLKSNSGFGGIRFGQK